LGELQIHWVLPLIYYLASKEKKERRGFKPFEGGQLSVEEGLCVFVDRRLPI